MANAVRTRNVTTAPLPPIRTGEDVPADLLFEEAHRRRTRIRAASGLAVVVSALLIAAAAFSLSSPASRSTTRPAASDGKSGGKSGGSASPVSSVVWMDYRNRLRVGNVTGRSERVLATVEASPLTPVVVAAGLAYVVDTAGTFVPSLGHWSEVVDTVDLATGAVRFAEPGDWVFPAGNGRDLFVSQSGDSSVFEISPRARHRTSTLTLPHGWYLPGGFGVAAGQYIVVQSNDSGTVTHPDAIGLWNPRRQTVHVLMRSASDYTAASPDHGIVGATAPTKGRDALLVWMRPSCRPTASCPLEVTDTTTMRTRTLASPLRKGFAPGGTITPAGRRIVAFALGAPGAPRTAQVAVIDLATGATGLVPRARVELGQVAAWAIWLPRADAALAGTAQQVYEVQVARRSARPVVFRHGSSTLPGPDFSSAPAGG